MSARAIYDERTLTELDHARLARLLDVERAYASPLGRALDAAHLVPSQKVRPEVITMGSQVVLGDLDTGKTWAITLCYPEGANPSRGLVSVLSPVGASLIGLQTGDVARWRTPDGEFSSARVVALLFQPEASGLYSM